MKIKPNEMKLHTMNSFVYGFFNSLGVLKAVDSSLLLHRCSTVCCSSVNVHLWPMFRFVTFTNKAAKCLTLKKTDSFQRDLPYNILAGNL